jgi:hypothetical protein
LKEKIRKFLKKHAKDFCKKKSARNHRKKNRVKQFAEKNPQKEFVQKIKIAFKKIKHRLQKN